MKKIWKDRLDTLKTIVETIGLAWPLIRTILVASGAMMVAVMVMNNKTQDEMDVYIADYKKFQNEAQVASAMADSLKFEIEKQEEQAATAVARARSLGVRVVAIQQTSEGMRNRAAAMSEAITDTLELARKILPVKDSIITQQDSIITIQNQQNTELTRALEHKDTTISLLTISRDSLQNVINAIPPAPNNPNRIFGIQLPSRKASFIVGAITGVALTFVLVK
jgi:hypothetical protein